jgi:hypothetical protein
VNVGRHTESVTGSSPAQVPLTINETLPVAVAVGHGAVGVVVIVQGDLGQLGGLYQPTPYRVQEATYMYETTVPVETGTVTVLVKVPQEVNGTPLSPLRNSYGSIKSCFKSTMLA